MGEKNDVPGVKSGRLRTPSERKKDDEDESVGFATIIKYGGVSAVLFALIGFSVAFFFTPELAFLGEYSDMSRIVMSFFAGLMGIAVSIILTAFFIILNIAKSMDN